MGFAGCGAGRRAASGRPSLLQDGSEAIRPASAPAESGRGAGSRHVRCRMVRGRHERGVDGLVPLGSSSEGQGHRREERQRHGEARQFDFTGITSRSVPTGIPATGRSSRRSLACVPVSRRVCPGRGPFVERTSLVSRGCAPASYHHVERPGGSAPSGQCSGTTDVDRGRGYDRGPRPCIAATTAMAAPTPIRTSPMLKMLAIGTRQASRTGRSAARARPHRPGGCWCTPRAGPGRWQPARRR